MHEVVPKTVWFAVPPSGGSLEIGNVPGPFRARTGNVFPLRGDP